MSYRSIKKIIQCGDYAIRTKITLAEITFAERLPNFKQKFCIVPIVKELITFSSIFNKGHVNLVNPLIASAARV